MTRRNTTTLLATLAALAMLIAGCGGSDNGSLLNLPHLQWGQVYRSAQVDVSAQKPTPFTSSDLAYPSDTPSWRSVLVITNRSDRAYSPAWLRVYASSDEQHVREIADPSNGCNGLASAPPVLPGETVGIPTCWEGDTAQKLTFTSLTASDTVIFSY